MRCISKSTLIFALAFCMVLTPTYASVQYDINTEQKNICKTLLSLIDVLLYSDSLVKDNNFTEPEKSKRYQEISLGGIAFIEKVFDNHQKLQPLLQFYAGAVTDDMIFSEEKMSLLQREQIYSQFYEKKKQDCQSILNDATK